MLDLGPIGRYFADAIEVKVGAWVKNMELEPEKKGALNFFSLSKIIDYELNDWVNALQGMNLIQVFHLNDLESGPNKYIINSMY